MDFFTTAVLGYVSQKVVETVSDGKLLSMLTRRLSRIGQARDDEFKALTNIFAIDVQRDLQPYYIEPFIQTVNPAEYDERNPALTVPKEAALKVIDKFLKEPPLRRNDGSHVLFILGDAGMGKTSLLLMLKTLKLVEFWPSAVGCELLKLGPGSVKAIEALTGKVDPRKTVLLLDSLDEDKTKYESLEVYLKAVLDAAKPFRQVIVTCRTQFIPRECEAPPEGQARSSRHTEFTLYIKGLVCHRYYLSPFTDEQVREYLEKRFPYSWYEKISWLRTSKDRPIDRAQRVANGMAELRLRPLLLSYIDLLLPKEGEEDDGPIGLYDTYDRLIAAWLDREVAKDNRLDASQLRAACTWLAEWMWERQRQLITREELRDARLLEPVLLQLELIVLEGRTLLARNARGELRFAYHSVMEFLLVEGWNGDINTVLAKWRMYTDTMRAFQWSGCAPRGTLHLAPYLVRGRLDAIHLGGVHLDGANFRQADLSTAYLFATSLVGADLRGANLHGANLQEANLQGANLQRTNLQAAILNKANLQGANLTQADLLGADLTGANLKGAVLTRADLRGAMLVTAEPSRPGGISLLGMRYDEHTIWPDGFTPPPSR